MANALWITLIGMGLVFVAILLLWGLMALMVRLTAEPEEAAAEDAAADDAAPGEAAPGKAAPNEVVETSLDAVSAGDLERKRRAAAAAAAAAVSIALALRKPARSEETMKPAGGLSAWQAVQRAGQFSQRTRSTREKVVR